MDKINSKWIKDVNVRLETIKCIEENIVTKLLDIGHRVVLVNLTPKASETKAKLNEWDHIKLKICASKEITKIKRHLTKWEKIFAYDTSKKGLMSRIYMNSYNMTTKKSDLTIGKGYEYIFSK